MIWAYLTSKFGKVLSTVGLILAAGIALVMYGQGKKREGRKDQAQKDRRTIDEMVERKEERRVITQPIDVERRRERVRRQRDELTKGVLRP